jgi:hypothetical protein
MNQQEVEFMAKVYLKIQEIEALTKEYGYEDRVMSAMIFGLIEEEMKDAIEEGRMVEMQSVFSFNLEDREELETVKKLMDATFEEPKDKGQGFSDLFGGIDLNLN